MAAVVKFDVEKRDGTGKGAARALRRDNKVPAIIYGAGGKEVKVSLVKNELVKQLNQGGFTSKLVELNVDGESVKALPREVQFHPVTEFPEHVDFLRVGKDSVINVWVKVEFSGREKCPGIRRGGVLNIVRHQVELFCNPESIPDAIHASLNGLQIGDSVHIEDIELPEGVKPVIADRNFTLGTIAGRAPKEEDLDAAPGAAVAPEEGEEGAEGEGGEEAAATEEGKEA